MMKNVILLIRLQLSVAVDTFIYQNLFLYELQ